MYNNILLFTDGFEIGYDIIFLEDATATNSKNLHYVSDSNKYNIVMNDY